MERPILFSTGMVQAIIAGHKTETRRIIKPQPGDDGLWNDSDFPRSLESKLVGWNGCTENGESKEFKCRYGQTGDILWVRESFAVVSGKFVYKADMEDIPKWQDISWKPSIHIPRRAARILLEVIDVKVERLQQIDANGAICEGLPWEGSLLNFIFLWGKINGPQSWDLNPWVWVIKFRRVQL